MRSPKAQTAIDFKAKQILSRRLVPELRKLFRQMVAVSIREVQQTGTVPPNFDQFIESFERLYLRHYNAVGSAFGLSIRRMVANEKKGVQRVDIETKYQDFVISMLETKARPVPIVVARHYEAKASAAARAVTESSRKAAEKALLAAQTSLGVTAGVAVTELEIASVFGGVYARSLNGRVDSIAMLETNGPAEAAKLTEIELIRGEEPSLSGIGNSTAEKTWSNMGDSVVRTLADGPFDHLFAEQTVLASEPFIVSGEKLLFPGDRSLGSSTGNVANCRCGAVYDIEEAAEMSVSAEDSETIATFTMPKSVSKPLVPKKTTKKPVTRKKKPVRKKATRKEVKPSKPTGKPPSFEDLKINVSNAPKELVDKIKDAYEELDDEVKVFILENDIGINIGKTAKEFGYPKEHQAIYLPHVDDVSSKWPLNSLVITTAEKDPVFAFWHELGHAIDFNTRSRGGGIASKSFSRRWRQNKKRLTDAASAGDLQSISRRKKLTYFLDDVENKSKGMQEAFAETFAHNMSRKAGKVSGRSGDVFAKRFNGVFGDLSKEVDKTVDKIKSGVIRGTP